MDAESAFPARLVFVGGAPRSGTTVTHALLCSAPGVSPYSPEISFFAYMVQAYWAGIANWDVHTHGHFPDQEAFRRTMADAARSVLLASWRRLGEPEVLCLKDPMLTPHFPTLNELLPEAKFVTVCRNPLDVVRSRQEAFERAGLGEFGLQEVRACAQEYFDFYWKVLNHDFTWRGLALRYEDLNKPGLRQQLASFIGVAGFDDARLWRMADGHKLDTDRLKDDPTYSPKYSGGIDLERRLPPLPPAWQEVVKSICRQIMTPMKYH